MKVVIMCSSFAVGGAENMVAQLIAGLDKTKFAVIPILSNKRIDNHIQKIVDESDVQCFYATNNEKKHLFARIKTFLTIHKKLCKEKPDIIHSNLSIAIYAVPYVIFHKVRYIHTVHNIPQKDAGKLMRLLLTLLVKLDKIEFTSISNSIQKEIVAEYRIDPSKAPVIVNPVDYKKFALYKNCSNNNDRIRFITAGRLAPQKNHKLLIQAFSIVHDKINDSSLSIAGDGILKNELLKQINDLGLSGSVSMLGNRSDLPVLFNSHDIFVLSSDYEGLPLTVLEAEASGLPIISTNVGGVKDIVSQDNGMLVSPNDPEQLANAMIYLAENKQLRETLGVNSRHVSKEYDLSKFINKYSNVYLGVKI